MPKLDGILETAIYTGDMVRARAFYEGVLGLEPIYSDARLCAYAVAGRDVLLVFLKGTTRQTVVLPSGTIPGHCGDGALHVAFAIGKDDLDRWGAHLASRGVAIEGRNDWSRGGRSIYFRDPDGHSRRTKRKAIASIQQSCSDSPAFANLQWIEFSEPTSFGSIMICLFLVAESAVNFALAQATRNTDASGFLCQPCMATDDIFGIGH